jgi:hypothetical protein
MKLCVHEFGFSRGSAAVEVPVCDTYKPEPVEGSDHRLNMELRRSPKFIWAPCAQQSPRICKRSRSPGIAYRGSIPPAYGYVARRPGTITLFVVPARQAT